MRAFLLVLMLAVSTPSLAQWGRDKGGRGQGPAQGQVQGRSAQQNMSHEERQRLREDVNSARGNYGRPEPRRQMAPEEREKLRRDVQDANREMGRR